MLGCQLLLRRIKPGASLFRKLVIGAVVLLALVSGASRIGAVAGDAFVSSDASGRTWTIGNSRIRVTFRIIEGGGFVLDQISSPETNRVFNAASGPDSLVTVNGTTSPLGLSSGGWRLEHTTSSETGTGVRLDFTYVLSGTSLTVVRSYVCYPVSPTIETWTTFESTGTGSVSVSNLNVWQLTVPATTVNYSLGLRSDAGASVNASFERQREEVAAGAQVTLTAPNRSTEQYLPMIAADLPVDEFFGGISWSGSWQITAQRTGSTLVVTAGLPRVTRTVDAGHPLETPHGFFGATPGSRNDVSEALRSFVVGGLRGGRGFESLVTYNTWFAYGTEIDEQSVLDEMAAAASMGVELFVVDAGWYTGSGSGSDFDTGLGTWEVDRARFPGGLGVLRSYAHDLGMKFGLWVEPERVDLTTANRPGLARETWLAKNNGSYEATRTAQVCLASDEAWQWVFDRLTGLLDEVQPDYLKWDNNLWVNCNRPGHGHGTADGNFAHVAGLYEMLGTLQARYPAMLIENCSQGGNRLDFGLVRYSDAAWMDDRTSPSVRVRHNLQGLMTFFPPQYLLSFAIGTADEPLSGAPDLPAYLRSRMPGVLGLTYRAAGLSARDREGIASEIALYKQLRAATRSASGRLLSGQAAIEDGPAWDALQQRDAASGDAVIYAFQNAPNVRRVALRPERLTPQATFNVTRVDGTPIGSASGADLMIDGIEIDSSPDSSAHVLLLQKSPMDPAPERTPVERSR